MTTTTNLHSVKVEPREGGPADVVFTCAGDSSAPCHQYPACTCDYYSEEHSAEHPDVTHEKCWVATWFDIGEGAVVYEGDDSTEEGWPTEPREGAISVSWDDSLLWEWAS